MSEKVERIRNIALIGHGGAGKTSLAEAMLYKSGTIKRFGKVEEGNTAMDFEPEELKRRSSISSGFHQFSWKNHTVNLIDTPGDQNFFSDTKGSMQAADGVIVVIDAVDGVKVQTELAWEFAKEFKQPCVIFINKLDRERADFNRTFEDAKVSFDPKQLFFSFPSALKLTLEVLWIWSKIKLTGMMRMANLKKKTSLQRCRIWSKVKERP